MQQQGDKGLRHFSMKVCEKVEQKVRTTYNEVADELVAEFGASHKHCVLPVTTQRVDIPPLQQQLPQLQWYLPSIKRTTKRT